MNNKPLLVFPKPTTAEKSNLNPFLGKNHLPSKEHQIQQFEEKISDLERVLHNNAASLQEVADNIRPEMVLVLETAGDIGDFYKAVKKTPGMEFLVENKDYVEPTDVIFTPDKDGNRTEKLVETRLFLTMTNQKALLELKKYWDEYKKDGEDQKFKRGLTKFRTLFEHLIAIRFYSVEDRVRDTGLEEQISDLKRHGVDGNVRFEVELAYKDNSGSDYSAFQEVERLLHQHEGKVVQNTRVNIPQISYHAFIAEAPIQVFDNLTESTNITFLKSQQILFFRPVGQMVFQRPKEKLQLPNNNYNVVENVVQGEPIVALLDGLPLENHNLLKNRITVDDPDGFSRNYTGHERFHGTGMASLLIHGDLEDQNAIPLKRPLYVRPIMKLSFRYKEGETLPDDMLLIDLIHRAVKRMKVGDGGMPATAPEVRIVNLSIGDEFRPFLHNMSSWARLLDWLSYEYDILFIISAGNETGPIELDISKEDFDELSPDKKEELILQYLIKTNYKRKILAPSESINALTVGAVYSDFSKPGPLYRRINLFQGAGFLSPVSRIGFGFRNSIKPDLLMPGGRKLYRTRPGYSDKEKTLLFPEMASISDIPPGNKIAVPGSEGNISKEGYSCGTSNSAALTSRLGAELYEVLLSLSKGKDGKNLEERYFTVLIKSLLVHSASWGPGSEKMLKLIKGIPGVARNTVKKNLLPYLGYGEINPQRIIYNTDERVTLLGCGHLKKDKGHIYRFPLPPSISSRKVFKKLVVTLAYNSPLNHQSGKYRKAHLFFDNLEGNGFLDLERPYYDVRASRVGTVQHDVLIGDRADAFVDGDSIAIKISCREDASGLGSQLIKYGLSVTLEVKEGIGMKIYEEVKQRLKTRIQQKM